MSTRGVIGKFTPKGWRGRYHHSDSYPTGLGAELWGQLHGHFKGDLKAMLKVLLYEHTGWSCILGSDFSLVSGYIEPSNERTRELVEAFAAAGATKGVPPRCYCHGDRHEDGWWDTDKQKPGDREWAYIFDVKAMTMTVLANRAEAWREIAKIDLHGAEPNWEEIEYAPCKMNPDWCGHYKWVHDKTVCKRCDGEGWEMGGGHTTDPRYHGIFDKDCSKCVPVEKLPVAYRERRNLPTTGYHVTNFRECEECDGTGKAKIEEAVA